MENDYYSDEEEDLSIHSSFANFSNNKLPKINKKLIIILEKAEIMI